MDISLPQPHYTLTDSILLAIPTYTYGDVIQTKSSHHFYSISCHLGCLPIDPMDCKHERLAAPISTYQADAVALQEVGLNFSNCHGQWAQRMGYNCWYDTHCEKHVLAWNTTDPRRTIHQWGGTGILAVGDTTHYAAGSDVNPTNLGGWCWT